jgi:hypothetical protein
MTPVSPWVQRPAVVHLRPVPTSPVLLRRWRAPGEGLERREFSPRIPEVISKTLKDKAVGAGGGAAAGAGRRAPRTWQMPASCLVAIQRNAVGCREVLPCDSEAHGGAPWTLERSIATCLHAPPPAALTIVQIEPRTSPIARGSGDQRCSVASMARQDPWARADADWTLREGSPGEGQHAPITAPRNARLARVTASRAARARGASRLRPRLLDRTSAPLALWTCRR